MLNPVKKEPPVETGGCLPKLTAYEKNLNSYVVIYRLSKLCQFKTKMLRLL